MPLNLKLLPDKGYERLEPYAMKVARTVLRKGRTSNRSSLFDVLIIVANINFLIVGQPVEIADQNEMYIL